MELSVPAVLRLNIRAFRKKFKRELFIGILHLLSQANSYFGLDFAYIKTGFTDLICVEVKYISIYNDMCIYIYTHTYICTYHMYMFIYNKVRCFNIYTFLV